MVERHYIEDLDRVDHIAELNGFSHLCSQHGTAQRGVEGDQASRGIRLIVSDNLKGFGFAVQQDVDLGAKFNPVGKQRRQGAAPPGGEGEE